jgi:hypothetical protein
MWSTLKRAPGWKPAGEHLVWQVLVGIAVPFLLGYLTVPFRSGIAARDLISGGELHLASGMMLFSSIPIVIKGMLASGRLRTFWLLIGAFTFFVMIASVLVWSELAALSHPNGDQTRIAIEGGVWAALIAGGFSYLLAWRGA